VSIFESSPSSRLTNRRVGEPPLDFATTMARGNFSLPANITCGAGKMRPGSGPSACTCDLKAGATGQLRVYAVVA
jgi:hypothetical protein